MAITLGRTQKAEMSGVLEEQLQLIKDRAILARNNITPTVIDYAPCHYLSRAAWSLENSLSQFQSQGWTLAAIGANWADDRNLSWASVSADFAALRTALTDYTTWMNANKDEFSGPTIDAQGVPVHNVPLSAGKQAELVAKLNAIIGKF